MVQHIENIIIRSEDQSSDTPLQTDFSGTKVGNEYQFKAVLKLVQKVDVKHTDQDNIAERTDLIFSIVSVEKLKERI